jgi:hypothetical protein
MSTRYLSVPYYCRRGWVYRVLCRLAGEYLGDGLLFSSDSGDWITWKRYQAHGVGVLLKGLFLKNISLEEVE